MMTSVVKAGMLDSRLWNMRNREIVGAEAGEAEGAGTLIGDCPKAERETGNVVIALGGNLELVWNCINLGLSGTSRISLRIHEFYFVGKECFYIPHHNLVKRFTQLLGSRFPSGRSRCLYKSI